MCGLSVQPYAAPLGLITLGICLVVCCGLNSSADCPSESLEIPLPVDSFGHSRSDCRSSASCRDQPCLAGETCECTPKCGLRCETICPTVEPTFDRVGMKLGPCRKPSCQPGMKCIHRYEQCLCVAGCGHRCLVRLRSEPGRAKITKKEPCELIGQEKTFLWSGLKLENMCRGFTSCNTSADCLETQYCKCNQICGLICFTRPVRKHQSTTQSTVLTTSQPEPCELIGQGKTFLWSGLKLENMCRGFTSCNTSADCLETQYCKCNHICGLICFTRPVRKHQSTTQSTVLTTSQPDAGLTTFATVGNTVKSTGEVETPRSPKWSVCNLYKHRHVCGSDGITYMTLCDFRDRREGDVYIQHRGSCHAKPTGSAHDGMRFRCNTTLQRGDQLNVTNSTDFQQICTNRSILSHHGAKTELGSHLCENPKPCESNSDCTGKDEICICVILTPRVQAAVEEQEYTQPPESSTSWEFRATDPHVNLTSTPTTGSPQTAT